MLQKEKPCIKSKNFWTEGRCIFFFFFLEHQWVFKSSVIVAYESLSCPRWEKMDLKIIVIVGKGSNTQKCCKTKESVGAEGFFWRTAGSLTVQDKQRDSWTTITKQKNTAVDHSGNNTLLRIKRMQIKLSFGLHVNIFYVKYFIQVSTK